MAHVDKGPGGEKHERRGDRFTLRPDAHAMAFSELRSPERKAVGQLLLRFAKCIESVDEGCRVRPGKPKVATSFLVSGERGTGKTTVLLSARLAVENPEQFFKRPEANRADDAQAEQPVEGFDVDDVKRVCQDLAPTLTWLTPLNMEFFPDRANLLTALLVRIRDALVPIDETPIREHGRGLPEPVLEEGTEDAWTEIDRLMSNATLMWEGVDEKGPREHVEEQIDAVQTYANFSERLKSALSHVMKALQRKYAATRRVLVLPIDNADRSAKHLVQILKLIRLAACPQLWYVIAASQSDIDLFVERSYRDELKVGEAGRADASELEKIGSVARRQAATTQRTVLPPAHRIDVGAVPPEEVLQFTLDSTEASQSIGRLFEAIRVQWPGAASRAEKSLLELLAFDAGHAEKWSRLTRAGKGALQLPIRNVVDVWQSAYYWSVKSTGRDQDPYEDAINLVDDVLRNLIAESELPDWACNLLRDDVIYRNQDHRVCLDFRGNPIRWRPRFSVRKVLKVPSGEDGGGARDSAQERLSSKLLVHEFYGYALELGEPTRGAGASSASGRRIELPGRVQGWLMVLYDLLNQRQGARVALDASTREDDENPMLVQTEHRICTSSSPGLGPEILPVRLSWTMPVFDLFYDFDRVATRWQEFVEEELRRSEYRMPGAFFRRWAAAWLDNILSVALDEQVWAHHEAGAYEDAVAGKLRTLLPQMLDAAREQAIGESGRTRAVRSWLLDEALLSTMPEYLWSIGREIFTAIAPTFKLALARDPWDRRLTELGWHRYLLMRNAVLGAIRRWQDGHTPLLNERELHVWKTQICERWFASLQSEYGDAFDWAEPFAPPPSGTVRRTPDQPLATSRRAVTHAAPAERLRPGRRRGQRSPQARDPKKRAKGRA